MFPDREHGPAKSTTTGGEIALCAPSVERTDPAPKASGKPCKPRKPRPTLKNPLELDYFEARKDAGAHPAAPTPKQRKGKADL